ncbi:MAG TPA: MBL fold metallo-hydrolase [Thermoanaerobaculia bacterium]
MRLLTALLLALLPTLAAAQNRTEILLLGTAGGPPLRVERSEPSTLLIVDGRRYLIDCGIGTIRRLLRAGIPSETIGTIFITHHHPDHDLGLADMMSNDIFEMNLANAQSPIDVYGPVPTKEFVDAAFRYIGIPYAILTAEPSGLRAGLRNHALTNPFTAHEIQHDGVIFQDDKIRVVAAENSHFSRLPAAFAAMKSFSYRFETPHGSVVFTGDTGPSDALIKLAKGADVLVSEVEDLGAAIQMVRGVAEKNHWPADRAQGLIDHMRLTHLDLPEVANIATKAGVKSVVLYHFDPKDPAAHVAAVKKSFAGPVFAGADLDRYCLNAPSFGPCHE